VPLPDAATRRAANERDIYEPGANIVAIDAVLE
jgi:hypothetical protein